MTKKIGMRIPPKIGADGMEAVTKFAVSIGLDVIDVPFYNQEIKSILENAGLEVGSIDGVGAVGRTKFLSENENSRQEAVEALKTQMSEVSELGGKVLFMCLVPDDITMPRKQAFEIWKETF